MQAFIVDLIGFGTRKATIFQQKFVEEYARTLIVSKPFKYLCFVIAILINFFCLYYCVVTASIKSKSWRDFFVLCLAMQSPFEVFISATLECLWVHVAVPFLIRDEVAAARKALSAMLEDLLSRRNRHEAFSLDATRQLFVSTRLAAAHPQLIESTLVLGYRAYLPGGIAETWHDGSALGDADGDDDGDGNGDDALGEDGEGNRFATTPYYSH